ncbi:MAG: aminotransferase class III-fold pyridoxal phosphate-dependent enzyme, partial [Pseudonocardia sp.]|nr:aminotransferase class III-fold pyridoxal phosphate-dependent enzyme [Pseudonocardia sp.]
MSEFGGRQPVERAEPAGRVGTASGSSAQGGLTARWQAAMMNNYGTPPLALVRGSGAEVWDAEGRRYLDLLGGIAVNSLGHAHPAVVEAVTSQISTLGHTSNLYITEPPLALAEKLLELLDVDGARVLFCNSGTEAVEAAFKIARRTGRPGLVACEGAFHGRTMGA